MASIDIFCKICDNGEHSASSKLIINGNKIINDDGASDFNFKEIFMRDVKVAEIYSNVSKELTQYFLRNYNTCLILIGTSPNIMPLLVKAKGTPHKEPVLISYIVEQLHNEFNKKIKSGQGHVQSMNSQSSTAKDEINMYVYEVIGEQIKDLVVMSRPATNRISVIGKLKIINCEFIEMK